MYFFSSQAIQFDSFYFVKKVHSTIRPNKLDSDIILCVYVYVCECVTIIFLLLFLILIFICARRPPACI